MAILQNFGRRVGFLIIFWLLRLGLIFPLTMKLAFYFYICQVWDGQTPWAWSSFLVTVTEFFFGRVINLSARSSRSPTASRSQFWCIRQKVLAWQWVGRIWSFFSAAAGRFLYIGSDGLLRLPSDIQLCRWGFQLASRCRCLCHVKTEYHVPLLASSLWSYQIYSYEGSNDV